MQSPPPFSCRRMGLWPGTLSYREIRSLVDLCWLTALCGVSLPPCFRLNVCSFVLRKCACASYGTWPIPLICVSLWGRDEVLPVTQEVCVYAGQWLCLGCREGPSGHEGLMPTAEADLSCLCLSGALFHSELDPAVFFLVTETKKQWA